ncbi:unannotated protein [freshwater metagenome]|uniref:Unannotated protein n=1 Tax=freshwater metagenome TaxID=449393 RepID=A0A6J6HCE8_9ZZZZ
MFDNFVDGSGFNDSKKFLLSDKGTLLKSFSFDNDVCEPNEPFRNLSQRPKTNKQRSQWCSRQRCAIGMQDGIGFRNCFSKNEKHHHVESDTNRDTCCTKQPARNNTSKSCLHRLTHIHGKKQRVNPPFRMSHQNQQCLTTTGAGVGQGLSLWLRNPRETHFGDGQHDEKTQQHHNGCQHPPVGRGGARCNHSSCSCLKPLGTGPFQ